MVSVHVLATPTIGFSRSASVKPMAFRYERAGARSRPSRRVRLRWRGSCVMRAILARGAPPRKVSAHRKLLALTTAGWEDRRPVRPEAAIRVEESEESIPAGVRESSGYLPEIESLRGVAIALVVWFHADGFVRYPGATIDEPVSPLLAFLRAGHTGVDLFFVLSGFLLALPFLDEALGGTPVSVRRYFSRRALRILPLYYLAVVASTVLVATRAADLLVAVPYLLFLN